MGLLEDALRDTFNNRVAAPPAVDDLAGQAIRRAGAVRRRQVTVASVAVVVTVVLVGVGMLSASPLTVRFGSGPGGAVTTAQTTTPPPAPLVGVKLPVDVLNGDRIQVSDGRVISLAGLGVAQAALRVSAGWLVRTTNNLPAGNVAQNNVAQNNAAQNSAAQSSAVWLVDEKGFASQLAAGETTMVSAGTPTRPSPQVAWTAAGRLNLASLVGRNLSGTASTTGADQLVPIQAVAGGVLLGGSQTSGATATATWDMWYPDKGAYKSTPTSSDVSAVVGGTADGTQLFALTGTKPACLRVMEPPPQFTVVNTTCSLALDLNDKVYASPTGSYLLVVGASTYAVYDSTTIWTSPRATAGGALAGDRAATGTWINDTTFAVYSRGTVVRLTVLGAERSEVDVPDPNASGAKGVIEDVR
jgi:hypothetical protein